MRHIKEIKRWTIVLLVVVGAATCEQSGQGISDTTALDTAWAEGRPLLQDDYKKAADYFGDLIDRAYAQGADSWAGAKKIQFATYQVYIGKVEEGEGALLEVLQQAESRADTALLINALSELAQFQQFYGTPEAARAYLARIEPYVDENTRPTTYANYLRRSAELANREGESRTAIQLYLKALALYDAHADDQLDKSAVAGILTDVGVLYHHINESFAALPYLQRALALFEPVDPGYPYVVCRTAVVAARVEALDEAEELLTALDAHPAVPPPDIYLGEVARATVHLQRRESERVISILEAAPAIDPSAMDPGNHFYRLQLLYEAQLQRGATPAIPTLLAEMEAVAQSDIQRAEVAAARAKYAVLTTGGAAQIAALEEALDARAATAEARHRMDLFELDARYQTSLKDQQLAERDYQLELSGLRSQRLLLLSGGLLLGLLALLAGGWVIRRNNRRLRELNAQVEKLNGELRHRAVSSLVLASNMLKAQGRSTTDEKSRQLLAENESRIQAITTVQRCLNQVDKEVKYDEILKKVTTNLVAGFDRPIRTDLQLAEAALTTSQKTYLPLIVNELLTNSLKYAFGGVADPCITIKTVTEGDTLRLTYRDNGPGKGDTVQGTGQGSELLRTMIEQLNGRHSEWNEDGYCFQLQIPLTYAD